MVCEDEVSHRSIFYRLCREEVFRVHAMAAAEFQKILDNKGVSLLLPMYPAAFVGLARGAAMAGDVAKSRRAYQDFLALWKDADPDIPLLVAARQEYARLK